MKKGTLLNSDISALIARLGHTDSVTIGDAGLPIPQTVPRIDLALVKGLPAFMQVVGAVTEEMQVERATLAEEMKTQNPAVHEELLALITALQTRQGNTIDIQYVSHAQFKQQTQHSHAVIRSGECSPYANVILSAGVTF